MGCVQPWPAAMGAMAGMRAERRRRAVAAGGSGSGSSGRLLL
jgi:hypothetical protein